MRQYKITEQIGNNIKKIRKQQSRSQEEIAHTARMHLTTYGRLERGESNPPLYTLYKVAKALKVNLKDLF